MQGFKGAVIVCVAVTSGHLCPCAKRETTPWHSIYTTVFSQPALGHFERNGRMQVGL